MKCSLGISNFLEESSSHETGSFVEMWMKLDNVVQSEVSQKEKSKYRVLMHIHVKSGKLTLITYFHAGIEMQT